VSGLELALEARERSAQRLLDAYVEAVDSKDLDRWVGLFAEEASYIVTSRDNFEIAEQRGLRPVGFVHDHSHDRILDRVTLIRKAWEGHFDDYQPRHVLSPCTIDPIEDEDAVSLRASVAIYITEPGIPASRLLAVGQYRDVVAFTGDGPRFRSKLVLLDTTTLPRYFVYPL
jgi:3-phenylpropionate/cinnamic acid dioxygenase small subunit